MQLLGTGRQATVVPSASDSRNFSEPVTRLRAKTTIRELSLPAAYRCSPSALIATSRTPFRPTAAPPLPASPS